MILLRRRATMLQTTYWRALEVQEGNTLAQSLVRLGCRRYSFTGLQAF